jgi:aconitate hydratase
MLGDGITTDHISPNGAIRPNSPAGEYLVSRGADPKRLGNFGVRRGNADVCVRGMFDNTLLDNELVSGERGNWTVHQPSGETMTIYEAGRKYAAEGTPTIIVSGRGYGAGSSRDWAAKGLRLLGVVAVLVESFERIHRSNLVGMGILPLAFPEGVDRKTLGLTGREELRLDYPNGALAPKGKVGVQVSRDGAEVTCFDATVMAFSDSEIAMIKDGGVLPSIMSNY